MDTQAITDAFISQYQAALAMFRSALSALPVERWDHRDDLNRTWRIASHVLFFTHLYLTGSEETFEPWEGTRPGFDPRSDPLEGPGDEDACTREEMLRYADAIEAMLPAMVAARPYEGPSGFSWIKVTRYEHHIRNIRHLQHHTGQIAERARAAGGGGTEWSGAGAAARLVES